ncbi:UDP-3-O-(3-hydroxymyristoyl)glucosamine N-acyltransferase [Mariprofundus sp. EBB-1]|uniref:UDP-3-O-(3-hydroxymyristoyl)glucosamine N-acyltransferase n=1 Tax=Mariprofundus sp. EBB-1 TaxID=2650971 RepID=UPI000EF1D78D|nr:UDP-3-O-(3-hydroxymyristoyl)glucosamine N-acyltransferase [Mariprofundus sp. EBB-1]RLL52891.1 UDP-3-O-(3-hydroxymyristoyl)glucosamine N-acyltransferase [Mariprofundus sp. EBB-1]
MSKTLSLAEVVDLVQGQLDGCAEETKNILVTGINTLRDSGDHDVTFLANKRYQNDLKTTKAAAVLVAQNAKVDEHLCLIRVKDPYFAFACLQRLFHPGRIASGKRHASAVIDDSAILADNVDVAAGAIIGASSRIGEGTRIGAGCVIGEGVQIGTDCLLHPKSVIADHCLLGNEVILQSGAIIGSDGFGYAWSGTQHLKIPQVGRVILEDDVEIGANTCIDRGAIGDTVIERGVKLDNQIQIAHNVRIGAYSVMASQVGISGSTHVGSGCQFGGQAGLAGHINIGDGVKLAAKSGVMSDLEAGGIYAGAPAMPHRLWLKVSALTAKLPEIWKAQRTINKT